jgi:hypothetical protein
MCGNQRRGGGVWAVSDRMECVMERQKPVAINHHRRPWLVVAHGRRLQGVEEDVAPLGEPESILEVEFEGLTDEEQRAALDAFPGGRRFRLASPRH